MEGDERGGGGGRYPRCYLLKLLNKHQILWLYVNTEIFKENMESFTFFNLNKQ